MCRLACAHVETVVLESFVAKSIVSDVRDVVLNKLSTYCSKLQATVKTHKPAGEVVARPLHTSRSHVLAGLSAWIDLVLSSLLRKMSFLCKDSSSVISHLKQVSSSSSTCTRSRSRCSQKFILARRVRGRDFKARGTRCQQVFMDWIMP